MLTAIDLYKKIAPKLGDEETTELIAFIEESIQRGVATKADLQEVARELETNFRKEIADVRKEIAELRGLLIKYILPVASLIGAVIGTIMSILIK